MQNTEPQKSIWTTIFNSLKDNKNTLLQMWLILASIYIISLLLGIGIFLIVIGALFAIRRIMIYWSPARAWMIRAFGLKVPEPPQQNKSILYQRLITIYHFGISLIYIIIGSYIIKLGSDILIRDGFLDQNLIYAIFFK